MPVGRATVNLWRELPPGPDWPTVVYVVVEIPKKSRNKYEYDEKGGFVKLDRGRSKEPVRVASSVRSRRFSAVKAHCGTPVR